MPFNEQQKRNLRRDSWPPTIVRIPEDLESIDENPISFFLTSPEDMDDFLSDDELSAGIDPKLPEIREVSTSSLQRVPRLEEDDEEEFDVPMTLQDFTERHNSGRKSRTGQHKDGAERLAGLGIMLPEHAAMRGRPRVKLVPEGRGHARGRARTLSARRPQSWREPSPEIFSIKEEREDEGEIGGTAMGRSVSTPGMISGGILKMSPSLSPSPGPKKRVHWADI
ncbi:hypothetical protein LAWI1_G001209 [Lachnellula willkommii]|uniref:Uncharacterized protein n=1 Tax=Lachnellula willkommii TaxID=215461 RepID=A0A559MNE4_9HELO|nr:hypothetical protein LAWI1_G001209 [Lachnellula willkommii]